MLSTNTCYLGKDWFLFANRMLDIKIVFRTFHSWLQIDTVLPGNCIYLFQCSSSTKHLTRLQEESLIPSFHSGNCFFLLMFNQSKWTIIWNFSWHAYQMLQKTQQGEAEWKKAGKVKNLFFWKWKRDAVTFMDQSGCYKDVLNSLIASTPNKRSPPPLPPTKMTPSVIGFTLKCKFL